MKLFEVIIGETGLRIFDSWEISVVYNRMSGMRGWDGCSPPQCRIVNDLSTSKRQFLFLCFCRGDRFREIPIVQYLTWRGVAWMMLLHDLLHILACTSFPPKKIVDAQSRCTDIMIRLRGV